jgi:hypothetical protein
MTDTAIKLACAKVDMKPVCDHSHYNDGGCVVVGRDW